MFLASVPVEDRVLQVSRDFLFSLEDTKMGCRARCVSNCTGTRDYFPRVKRPRRGVDHPTPSNAEVKERIELYIYFPYRPS